MSEWCCDWFDRMLEHSGEKGMSVIAFRDGDYRSFYIQARTFEKESIEEFDKIDPVTGQKKWPEIRNIKGNLIPFSVSQQIPIVFCPSCGTKLISIIANKITEYDKLVFRHSNYW
jgi:hypothetical protein